MKGIIPVGTREKKKVEVLVKPISDAVIPELGVVGGETSKTLVAVNSNIINRCPHETVELASNGTTKKIKRTINIIVDSSNKPKMEMWDGELSYVYVCSQCGARLHFKKSWGIVDPENPANIDINKAETFYQEFSNSLNKVQEMASIELMMRIGGNIPGLQHASGIPLLDSMYRSRSQIKAFSRGQFLQYLAQMASVSNHIVSVLKGTVNAISTNKKLCVGAVNVNTNNTIPVFQHVKTGKGMPGIDTSVLKESIDTSAAGLSKKEIVAEVGAKIDKV